LKSLSHKDLLIVHLSVGALHNISIPMQNKVPLIEAGILPLIIEVIKNKEQPNPLIQFSAVGTLKSLLATGDKMIKEFVAASGLEILIQLANGELNPKIPPEEDEDEKEKEKKVPDKRVQYETARVLVRFLDQVENAKTIAKLGGIPSILDLLNTKFAILQMEGIKAILTLAQIDELKEILLQCNTLSIVDSFQTDDISMKESIVKIQKILRS